MMTKQTNIKQDLTKKELIKILETIDSERMEQDWEYCFLAKKELDCHQYQGVDMDWRSNSK